jgi:hypothetical protein
MDVSQSVLYTMIMLEVLDHSKSQAFAGSCAVSPMLLATSKYSPQKGAMTLGFPSYCSSEWQIAFSGDEN